MTSVETERLETLLARHHDYAMKTCALEIEVLRLKVCAGDGSITSNEANRDISIIQMRLWELKKWIILGKKEIRDLKRKRACLAAEAAGLNPKDPRSLITHASALLQRLKTEDVAFDSAELGIVDALQAYLKEAC